MEEAIARRKQEKEQWGTILSGRESSSLSGLPELTQPGTGTVGGVTDSIADSKVTDTGSITVRLPGKPASDSPGSKTVTGNIVKLVGGKQDSKKDDPASSVGDLSGLPTLSPDSLITVQQPETIGKQPETIGKQPETIAQQPETGRWVTDSQGDWVWKPGKDDSRPPDLGGNWETSKWMGRSDYWWEWQPVQEGDQLYWKPILQTRIRNHAWWNPFYDSASYDSEWDFDYKG